jgi:hypothetical protein
MKREFFKIKDVNKIVILGDGIAPKNIFKKPLKEFYKSIFKNAQIIGPREFNNLCHEKTNVFETAIVSDRGKSYRIKECSHTNKYLSAHLDNIESRDIEQLTSLMIKNNKLEKERNKKKSIIYVARKGDRKLSSEAEESLLSHFNENEVEIEKCFFEDLSFREQLKKSYHSSCMIGVHGNGLTNSIFMRPGSKVIELFPKGCYMHDYEILCRLKDHIHYPLDEDGSFIKGTHRGHSSINEEVKNINTEKIFLIATS